MNKKKVTIGKQWKILNFSTTCLHMSEMYAAKNKLTRLEPHWNFILPHINMCSSPERRPLKLYLFLIWWAKLDYKNKHTWSICIIPVAEIHLPWIMAMTKTNKWGLPPSSGPLLGICYEGNLHPSPFSPTLNTNCFFSCRSTVCSGYVQRYWSAVLV